MTATAYNPCDCGQCRGEGGPNPGGLCFCGCGTRTGIASRTRPDAGWIAGEHKRYINSHAMKGRKRPDFSAFLRSRPISEHPNFGKPNPAFAAACRANVGEANPNFRPERYRIVDCGYRSECWVWELAKDWKGYGRVDKAKAHKVMFEARFGPVPRHLELDHLCNVRACVNPDHLEPVTHAENLRRARVRRQAANH